MPPTRRAANLLLELDLTRPPVESEPDDPVGKLRSRAQPRLRAIVDRLHQATTDDQVVGLVAKLGAPLPLATTSELRAAIVAFANSGKPTVAWAETFGDAANGTTAYALATAFREIWLQPSGGVNLLGVMTEVTFLRGALDKLGIEPQLSARHEYKSAADRITRTEFTSAHREALDRLSESAWNTLVDDIAAGRELDGDEVRRLADQAPLSAAAAHDAGLVDRLGYRDEVYAELRRRLPDRLTLRFVERWKPSTSLARRTATLVSKRHQPFVAAVEAHGAIVTGRSRRSPMGGAQVGSDTVSAALRAAGSNERARAVLLRVDSPGGSYVASDTIWREVQQLRDTGKPVIVSMGNLAASGGYFISCNADAIVATPGTLTGSIGVFGGKPVVTGLLDKVGLATGAVSRGAQARMYSPRRRFSDAEWERLDELLDAIYDDFTSKVAAGRSMTRDAVEDVARGRVWSGADAVGNGLVDVLGGWPEAVNLARERAGMADDAPVRPAVSPAPLAVLRRPTSSDDPRASSATLGPPDVFANTILLMPPVTLR